MSLQLRKLFFLCLVLQISLFAQSTYYVSTTGNDSNDGSSGSPWLTIQGAINNSNVINGDIIIVRDGTYNESVNVTKELTIQSENGYLSTTVVATSITDHCFDISANNVTLDGFTAYGATGSWWGSGVYVTSNNCIIQNNRCGMSSTEKNWKGITLYGGDNNIIKNNKCNYNSEIGIQLCQTAINNMILNNECSNNSGAGTGAYGLQIDQTSSISNDVRGNLIENNGRYGIYIRSGVLNLGNNDTNDKGRNTIQNNDGGNYQIHNNTANAINAYYNYFGYTTEPEIEAHTFDYTENSSLGEINFNPWLTEDQALPIELISFSATANENTVMLNWQTATEVNNYGFNVECTVDNVQWETRGFVEGNGTTNSPKQYSFTDLLNLNHNLTRIDYRLKQIDNDGTFAYSKTITIDLSSITNVDDEVLYTFALEQNYPNPFNPTTTIKFTVPTNAKVEMQNVRLVVYNSLGECVETLVNELRAPGTYEVQFDASNFSSGVYIYKLAYGNRSSSHKMLLLK